MITELSKPVRALAAALLLFAVAGCADKANPDNVDRRSIERWNLLIAHDSDKAYEYLSPGYRSTHPREAYVDAMNNRPLQWKTASFNHKECEEDRCTVVVDVAYTLKVSGGAIGAVDSKSAQTETWIRIDGDWYFLPK